MKEVIYGPKGEAVSDFSAEEYANRLLPDEFAGHDSIYVSSALVVHYVRCLIHEGKLNCDEVTFVYRPKPGEELAFKADKNGRFHEWPLGFCDHMDFVLERLLRDYPHQPNA